MKRYLLFVYWEGYDSYDSPKGWDAFEGDFDDAQEAADKGTLGCDPTGGCDVRVWEVVDTATKQVVLTGNSGTCREYATATPAEIAAHPEMRPTNVSIV